MKSSRAALACLACALAAAPSAAADEGEPPRSGFTIGFGVGGAALGGTGDFAGISGGGGGGTLRVGTTATPTLLWVLQLDTAGVPIRDGLGDITVNQQSLLTLGGQWYAREALWLKAGAGVAVLSIRAQDNDAPAEEHRGLAVHGSAGYDLVRRGMFAFDVELSGGGAMYGLGDFVTQLGLGFAVQWY